MSERKHRNRNGDICYTFAWEGGGGNHVYAHSKRAAYRRAVKLGAGTHTRNGDKLKVPAERNPLVPVEDTFRSVNLTELFEFDKNLYLAYSL